MTEKSDLCLVLLFKLFFEFVSIFNVKYITKIPNDQGQDKQTEIKTVPGNFKTIWIG